MKYNYVFIIQNIMLTNNYLNNLNTFYENSTNAFHYSLCCNFMFKH
jgi:hypothetical protein